MHDCSAVEIKPRIFFKKHRVLICVFLVIEYVFKDRSKGEKFYEQLYIF